MEQCFWFDKSGNKLLDLLNKEKPKGQGDHQFSRETYAPYVMAWFLMVRPTQGTIKKSTSSNKNYLMEPTNDYLMESKNLVEWL